MPQRWPFSDFARQRACRGRLIISLDLLPPREALQMAERIGQTIGMFEVGRNLFLNSGPDFVRALRSRGFEVFLDLRFHDTLRNLVRLATEATRLGVRMFDLHCGGNLRDLAATSAAVMRICRGEGLRRPYILALAMLSCVEGEHHGDAAVAGDIRIARFAQRSAQAGLDGVVTSPYEIAKVRELCSRPFIIVAAGVKPDSVSADGHECLGAAQAMRAGADYLIASASVWRASDPLGAVQALLSEMDRGLRAGPRLMSESTTPRSL
ncbi:MAG: orotidine 5'-phosphate decarboxylase / HUMPS family protein [Candidatus Binataceae bacterium]